jgi:hypothetical protein
VRKLGQEEGRRKDTFHLEETHCITGEMGKVSAEVGQFEGRKLMLMASIHKAS